MNYVIRLFVTLLAVYLVFFLPTILSNKLTAKETLYLFGYMTIVGILLTAIII